MDQVYGKQLWERQKGSRGEEVNCGEAWRAWSGVISVTIVDLHTSSSTIANTSINTNTNRNTATIDKIEMQNTIVVGCYFCGNRALPHIVLHASWSAKKQCKKYRHKDEYKYNSTMVLLLFSSTLSDKNWNTKHDRGEVSFLWQCLQAKRPSDRHFMRAQKYDPW